MVKTCCHNWPSQSCSCAAWYLNTMRTIGDQHDTTSTGDADAGPKTSSHMVLIRDLNAVLLVYRWKFQRRLPHNPPCIPYSGKGALR